MTNKIISYIIILSLISYLGCSSITEITKDDFIKECNEEKDKSDIYVTTKDYTLYYFTEDNYKLQSDSLYGEGEQYKSINGNDIDWLEVNGQGIGFYGNIAIKDIQSIEGKNYDYITPIGIVLCAVALFACVKWY